MASALLASFDSLCNVLVTLKDDEIQPEVCENKILRETVLGLEAVWAECQFILQQGALDFIRQILEYIPQLNETCRWQLRTALEGEIETSFVWFHSDNWAEKLKARQGAALVPARMLVTDSSGEVLDIFTEGEIRSDIESWRFPLIFRCKAPEFFARLDQSTRDAVRESLTKQTRQEIEATLGFSEEQVEQLRVFFSPQDAISLEDEEKQARQMLFETLPILMYLNELRNDIRMQDQHKDMNTNCPFRDLFCPNNERHHMLRRDFAKFDDQRFNKFVSFLLGELEEESEGERLQSRYFRNVYRQLREVAAFPTGDSPAEAIKRATWLQAEEILGSTGDEEDRARKKDLAAAEGCARWVCVQRVAQTVKPELFLSNPPEAVREAHANRALNAMHVGSQRSMPMGAALSIGDVPMRAVTTWGSGEAPDTPGRRASQAASRRTSQLSARDSSTNHGPRLQLQSKVSGTNLVTPTSARSTLTPASPAHRSTISNPSPARTSTASATPHRNSGKPQTAPQPIGHRRTCF